jgi:hypothetical protein
MSATHYHATIAVGHFARALQGQAGGRSRHPAIALLQALWLVVDPFADAPVVRIDLADLEGIVASAVRLRQVVAELVDVGALERHDVASRRYRLRKPAVEDLDASARVKLVALRDELEQARRLAAESKPASTLSKDARADALVRLGKKPSDIRDVLARMAGVAPGSLRYSGAGSGPVQAAISWLAHGATWMQFIAVCEYVQQDRDRPATDLVWLFGDQHRVYLQNIVDTLSAPTSLSAVSTPMAASDNAEHRELAEQVAALLGFEAEAMRPVVVQARSSGVFAHEILSETRAFIAGGPRPDWMPA